MKMMFQRCSLFALFLLFAKGALSAAPLTVYTVNYPLQYFAERIGDKHVEVRFPAPADVDPAFWMPDARTIAEYQKADLILLNGAGYAKWVNRVSLPRARSVDTSRGFRSAYLHVPERLTHSHGPGGRHSHAGIAFTTWLDMHQATEQARAVKEAFVRRRPAQAPDFERNYAALEKELLALDSELKALVARRADMPLVASHPVYQYLAWRYGLDLEAVMWEPEPAPDEAQWSELRALIEKHPARWMIWESAPNTESVKRLLDMGVDSLVYDPAGNRPEQGDFLSIMRRNIKNLRPAFE